MKIFVLTVLIYLTGSFYGVSQSIDKAKKNKIGYYAIGGVGVSRFNVTNRASSPNYTSPEFRIGAGIRKPINNILEVRTGLSHGLKVRRESYFYGPPSSPMTKEPAVMLRLDETVSNGHHWVIEVPIIIQANIFRSKLGLKAGINGRHWVQLKRDGDILDSTNEVGLIFGATQRIANRINVGLDFYHGFRNIFNVSGFSPNSGIIHYKVNNQYAQITLEYTL